MSRVVEVSFGNPTPRVGRKQADGTTQYDVLPEGQYTTVVQVAIDEENPSLEDAALQVFGAMKLHVPEDGKLAWVACGAQDLQRRLAALYGIEQGIPEDWK